MKTAETLQKLGFSKREAAVYLAVLENGQVTQTDIANVTKMNRTTLYQHITTLLSKNYLSQSRRGKRIYYSASNPGNILRDLEKAQAVFQTILPLLESTYQGVGHMPQFAFHEGPRKMAAAYRQAAKTAHYINSFSSPSNYLENLPLKEARKFDATTEERNVKPRVLCAETTENIAALKPFAKTWIDIKLLPTEMHSSMEFLMYNKTVLITSWERLFTVEIESEDITLFINRIFDYYWKATTFYQKGKKVT